MPDIVKVDLTNWYQILVEDCHAVITERIRNAREEVIRCWWEVGERIVTDPNYQKFSKGNLSAHRQLAADLGTSTSTLYFAMQFYAKFPDLEAFLEQSPHGKNLSWYKICNELLSAPKELPAAGEVVEVRPEIDFTPFHDLMTGCMVAYNHYGKRPLWLEHMGSALLQMEQEPFDGCMSYVAALKELTAALERLLEGK